MDNSHGLTRRKAIGITMSAAPPLQELHDEARAMLESGSPREQVDAYLRSVAVNDPNFGMRAFFGINRKVSRISAPKLALALGKHYAKVLKGKKVKDWLADFAQSTGLDRWLSDYILGWIDQGEPPAFAESQVKVVRTFEMGPAGDKVTTVGMLINAVADPEEAIEEFRNLCYRTFPPESFKRSKASVTYAERTRLYANEDISDTDIAEMELRAEGFDAHCVDEKEWRAEVQTRANSVHVTRKRWMNYLTNLLESVSPENPDS